jgi:EAL domain-containing protein (putative c-di-GMP-specific phosphodiesterase class I)/putative methionine-R-sulfoxide reductase with GAF domain
MKRSSGEISAQSSVACTEHCEVQSTGSVNAPDEGAAEDIAAALERLCEGPGLRAVVQPIVRLTDMTVVGHEALTRVDDPHRRSIQWWLDRATDYDLRTRFEVACWRAIAKIGAVPDDGLLFANVTPATLLEPELWLLRGAMPARLVIELTEQAPVDDYQVLRDELTPWLGSGARIAIDDTGAGYSSLRHVIELMPDFLKLDRAMVTEIDRHHNRLALVRSLVAFAREVGTSVIAEGIERIEELETLRKVGVAYGQGYLLARPGSPWPALGREHSRAAAPNRRVELPRQVRLHESLRGAHDAPEACAIVVDHIFGEGSMMPSLYLEHDGRLRCVAQRGLWQVLDGLSGDAGITGRTWATNTPVTIHDVAASPDYLEAIPGVVAEICVPIVVDGRAVGSLNVESLHPFPADAAARMRTYAQLLAGRLSVVGYRHDVSPWQRSTRASATLAEIGVNDNTVTDALRIICQASQQDSAGLLRNLGDAPVVDAACGPLSDAFDRLTAPEVASLSSVVDRVSSCYTAGEVTGLGFVGTESLRNAGARAVIVLPLRANGDRVGTIVLANTRPRRIVADDVEPLELLVAQLAAMIASASPRATR